MRKIFSYLSVFFIQFTFQLNPVFADKLCLRVNTEKRGSIRTSRAIAAKCPKGFIELVDTSIFSGPRGDTGLKGEIGEKGDAGSKGDPGAKGDTGPQGAPGAKGDTGAAGINGTNGTNGLNGTNGTNGQNGQDGAIRLYGDGSNGDVTFSSNGTLNSNGQYRNITIQSGVTMLMYSGATLRCTGSFVNNGTIIIGSGVSGGHSRSSYSSSLLDLARLQAGVGSAGSPAANGLIGTNGQTVLGGYRGSGILNSDIAQFLLKVGPRDGGGGGGVAMNGHAGRGGGAARIVCQGQIINSATGLIQASGAPGDGDGSGGGAGGIVILASGSSIIHSGVISAEGGAGALGGTNSASGGGGSGGIIHLLSPNLDSSGTFIVSGGNGGSSISSGTITSTERAGGGGGGGLGGNGGNGGDANTDGSGTAGTNGAVGISIMTPGEPLSLLL
jgi:hypothetical protein